MGMEQQISQASVSWVGMTGCVKKLSFSFLRVTLSNYR